MTEDTPTPYAMLREGLIWGRWRSGDRLKPQHLKDELGCTSAALREALLRLAGEGFVESEKNFGFRAITHSKETFHQAAHLRLVLETEASRLALRYGDFDWEMAVTGAYQKLAYIEEQMAGLDDVSKHVERWSLLDWEFHSTILSACNSPLLMRTYKNIYDIFRMYAASEHPNFGFSAELTIVEHKAIYNAFISRDEKACRDAIERHLAIYQANDAASPPRSTNDMIPRLMRSSSANASRTGRKSKASKEKQK